jgi:hypothetical protein
MHAAPPTRHYHAGAHHASARLTTLANPGGARVLGRGPGAYAVRTSTSCVARLSPSAGTKPGAPSGGNIASVYCRRRQQSGRETGKGKYPEVEVPEHARRLQVRREEDLAVEDAHVRIIVRLRALCTPISPFPPLPLAALPARTQHPQAQQRRPPSPPPPARAHARAPRRAGGRAGWARRSPRGRTRPREARRRRVAGGGRPAGKRPGARVSPRRAR